jgi:molybdopterin converting factor small subunit
MVTVVVSRGWAQRGRATFAAEPGPLPAILRRLADEEPEYGRRLLDGAGEPYRYLSIFVDAELVPRAEQGTTDVGDGSTVTILPPLAGG